MLCMAVQMGNGLVIVPVGGSLPSFGGGGVDPGYGIPTFPHVGQGLPGGGAHPGQPLPPFPGTPGHDLPNFPGLPGHPLPPGGIAGQPLPPLPPDQGRPGNPIVLPPQMGNLPVFPARPGNELPVPPGVIWPPLPPSVPQGKAIALVAISGVGYRWTVIDTSLSVGWPLPPEGGVPPTAGTPLPPSAAPKK